MTRPSNAQAERRVFRRKRSIPVGSVLLQLLLILLFFSGGIGIVVLLQRLPEQVDLMVLVSQAIADFISGIQLLLNAMVGLGVVLLIAGLVVLGGVLLLGACGGWCVFCGCCSSPSRFRDDVERETGRSGVPGVPPA